MEMDKPGPVGGGAKSCGFPFTRFNAGPFDTKHDLAYWLNNRLKLAKEVKSVPEDRPDFVVERLGMCHMDLHTFNIIVGEDDGRPWLIYWGNSGAYPSYFERANLSETRHTDFVERLAEAMDRDADQPMVERLYELRFAAGQLAAAHRGDLGTGEVY